jgi:hypothetical protein
VAAPRPARWPRARPAPCAATSPRVPSAAPSPPEPQLGLPAPRAAAARPPRRSRPAARVPLSAPHRSRSLETRGNPQGVRIPLRPLH